MKTDLDSYNLINHLQQQMSSDHLLLYYFCDYKDIKSQQTRTVVQTLLADAGRKQDRVLGILENRTNQYRKAGLNCSLNTLCDWLAECCDLVDKTHIVVDAIDESANRSELIQTLLSLNSNTKQTSLFLISRDEADIRHLLGHLDQISVESQHVASDMDQFIAHSVDAMLDSGRLKLRDKSIRQTIVQKLHDKADGMYAGCPSPHSHTRLTGDRFQYVKCQLDSLSQCISDRAVVSTIENLPSSLDQTYIRIFDRLKVKFPDTIDLIKWIFRCLVHSLRPLSLVELSQLAAFDLRAGSFDLTAVPTDPHDLLLYSGGLFRFSGQEQTVGLVHFSVKEFLESPRIYQTSAKDFGTSNGTPHLDMFKVCLSYLLLPEFAQGQCFTARQLELRLQTFAFFHYASCNVMNHYRHVTEDIGLDWEDKVISFLCQDASRGNLLAWRQMWYRGVVCPFEDLEYSDCLNLLRLDILPENPISYAAEYCNWSLTSLLVKRGYDVNHCADNTLPPILTAAFGWPVSRSQEVKVDWNYVRKLLELGSNPHAASRLGNLAFAIVLNGTSDDWDLLRELPLSKADLEARSEQYSGTPTVLQLLASHPADPAEWLNYVLDFGIDVDELEMFSHDPYDREARLAGHVSDARGPALHRSCFCGLTACVITLIGRGASVDLAMCELGSPLQAAARAGQRAIVQMLLDSNAVVDKAGGLFGTALQAAAWMGEEDIVHLLIDRGALVNSTSGVFGSPLTAAVTKQNLYITDLLLANGADPGTLPQLRIWDDDNYSLREWMFDLGGLSHHPRSPSTSPLTAAIFYDDKSLVQRLLSRGAEINFPLDRCRKNDLSSKSRVYHPLCVAIQVGSGDIIDLLQRSSADTLIGLGCPLLSCVQHQQRTVLRELMETITNPADLRDTMLEALYICENDEILGELTEFVARHLITFDLERLMLVWGSSISALKAKWLLSQGATPTDSEDRRSSLLNTTIMYGGFKYPLVSAIEDKSYDIVDVLLEAGIELNAYGPAGTSPLVAAVRRGDHTLTNRLLTLGASPTMRVFEYRGCYATLHQARGGTTIDLVLDYGVEVDERCDYCPTALWGAVLLESLDDILHLSSKGADVNTSNFEGETPLSYARQMHLDDVASLLEQLGGTMPTLSAQRAAQIATVIKIVSQFKSVSSEEPSWVGFQRWIMLGRCLFLLGDHSNSVIAMEMVSTTRNGAISTEAFCEVCSSIEPGLYHLCRDTGFGYCHSRCLEKHEREVARSGQSAGHTWVTYPRPYFSQCPAESVAIDELTHVSLIDWLDMVLARWSTADT